jgi:hypothetical protein
VSLIDEQIEQAGWSKPQVDKAVSGKADVCRQSFKAYRQAIHPKLKWNWAVEEITDELQLFYEAFEEGRRPKLAIEMPPQHGKSLAAEDFISWTAGKHPEWKTIYASYTDRLGMRINRNLYRVFSTVSHHDIFPDFMINQPGLVCNTELIEYVNGLGSFRNTTIGGSINGMELNLGVLDDYSKNYTPTKKPRLNCVASGCRTLCSISCARST